MNFKKLKLDLYALFHSIFWGMKSADHEILYQTKQGKGDGVQDEQEVKKESVYQDLLQENETEQVKEYRDKMYRIFREADKFKVFLNLGCFDRESGDFTGDSTISASVEKKDSNFFESHGLIHERKNLNLVLIQDQKIFDITNNEFMNGKTKPDSLITVNYGGFIPKFNISEYIKKLILWKDKNNDNLYIDLYFNDEQRHFNMTDALFIKNLNNILSDSSTKSDIFDISSLSFVTDKANGEEDLKKYSFDNTKLNSIEKFNGNFIVNFSVKSSTYSGDLLKKYETSELNDKYSKVSPKSNTISLDLAENLMNKNL